MPFSGPGDKKLPKNVKRLSETQRRRWVSIWNSAWDACRERGGSSDSCEASAFRQANGVVLKGNQQSYKLPKSARNNARKVLQWREEHGDDVKGMTEVGWRRARQLANNDSVNLETVKKIAGFNRHRSNYEAARSKQRKEGNPPWTYAAIVAWLGWGGTTAVDWARRITGAANNMQFITNRIQTAEVRRVHHEGKEWLVVPVVMLGKPAQVLNGELVTVEEVGKYPQSWDGRPIPVGHPMRRGQHVSASSLDVQSSEVIGQLQNTAVNGKLKAEMWLDIEKARELEGDALDAINRIEAGEILEVSTGYFRDLDDEAGDFDGASYHGIARNIRPDHLAILLHEEGACSIKDGCGAPRSNQKEGSMDEVVVDEPDSVQVSSTDDADLGENVQANLRRHVWNQEQAQQWLQNNGFNTDHMMKLANHYVFRQMLPAAFDHFRNDPAPFGFDVSDGVEAIQGVKGNGEDPPTIQLQAIKFYHGEEDSETQSVIRNQDNSFIETINKFVKGVISMAKPDKKTQLIDGLMANERCKFEREQLELLTEDSLEKMVTLAEADSETEETPAEESAQDLPPAEKPAEETPPIEVADGTETLTATPQAITFADPEQMAEFARQLGDAMFAPIGGIAGVTEAVTGVQANVDSAKQTLVEELVANELCAFSKEDLTAMDMATLKKLKQSMKPADYGGRALPRTNQQATGDFFKPMPAFNKQFINGGTD